MPDSKVEEVALALYVADGFTHPIGSSEESWAGDREDVRERYRVQARAAIAAMREPSEKMCEAAYQGCDTYWSGTSGPDHVWAVMIDKALEEG